MDRRRKSGQWEERKYSNEEEKEKLRKRGQRGKEIGDNKKGEEEQIRDIDASFSSSSPPFLFPFFFFFSVSNTWSLFYGWNMVFFILFLSEINDILQTHTDTGVRYVFYSLDFSRIWPHFPPGALKEFTDIHTLILKMYLRFEIAVCVVLWCTVT